jgi:hypothetical protein
MVYRRRAVLEATETATGSEEGSSRSTEKATPGPSAGHIRWISQFR